MTSHHRILLSALVIALASVSCTTVVRPPAAPVEPETVIVVTHGKSSSLILRDENGASRWAFGDWRYYALDQTGFSEAIAAILWPTPSALGRQSIESAPETPQAVVARFGIGIDEIFPITVESEAVRDLHQRLTTLFEGNLETLHYNPEVRLQFVHHPEPYTFFTNSNSRIARWLRELGCDVEGFPLLPRWRVEPQRR